ncbi:MaoC family dehydratase [Sphingomonas turrisvirgatae]|uniref:Acyl dehydratase n=1 Tax=Sphingomonas turrisvirgatae TaxID=1888892 RepID=A0A1E3LSY7_9SPHN|nr:MaoC family dehydratase [Sphingomonas turrisvirgatae]ODP36891.1 acyl dehydratase [Sphingomonas turrisvirgatae]
MRYFEDLAVGQKARFGSYAVTREEVLAFATKYDPQPFHLSDEAAAQTHFRRLAASGWHTCAMTMAMVVEDMKANATASLGAAGIDELRWLKPVFPGDTLHCETEIIEVKPSERRPERGSFLNRMTVINQHDEPVMTFIARGMIARRRPAA